MRNKDTWYLDSDQPSLRMWVFTQMTVGAAYAAAVFFGAIAIVLIIRAISYLLPEDPYAALEHGQQLLTLLA
ncbi:RC-LH1 core complex protein PufX [Palleronia rufa]|uniref:RC-LH1 core complex protein PufX n=1 Tax=Palleronia rufa TaxID=1530186 RepID=UPI000566B49E|nr:RC-LH1 core complex protein PufX [Palleronia rufa]